MKQLRAGARGLGQAESLPVGAAWRVRSDLWVSWLSIKLAGYPGVVQVDSFLLFLSICGGNGLATEMAFGMIQASLAPRLGADSLPPIFAASLQDLVGGEPAVGPSCRLSSK